MASGQGPGNRDTRPHSLSKDEAYARQLQEEENAAVLEVCEKNLIMLWCCIMMCGKFEKLLPLLALHKTDVSWISSSGRVLDCLKIWKSTIIYFEINSHNTTYEKIMYMYIMKSIFFLLCFHYIFTSFIVNEMETNGLRVYLFRISENEGTNFCWQHCYHLLFD